MIYLYDENGDVPYLCSITRGYMWDLWDILNGKIFLIGMGMIYNPFPCSYYVFCGEK